MSIVHGLAGVVLLFDLYVIYQQYRFKECAGSLLEREELFRLITENVADMIAVVDADGNRLLQQPVLSSNSRVHGRGSPITSTLDQIHPDDHQIGELTSPTIPAAAV